MRTHFHANERKCPSGVLCVFLSVRASVCEYVCACVRVFFLCVHQ